MRLIDRMILEQCLLFRFKMLGEDCRVVGYGVVGTIVSIYVVRIKDNALMYMGLKEITFTETQLDEWSAVLDKWVDSREQEIVFGRIRDMQSLCSTWKRYRLRFKTADEPHDASRFCFDPFRGEIVLPFGKQKSVWVFYIPKLFKSLGYVVTDIVSVSEILKENSQCKSQDF